MANEGNIAFAITQEALRYASQYLSTPALNGIFIHSAEYKETANSLVSQQMLINANGGARMYSDNIVLQPRRWQIKGYLKGTLLEITSQFIPSLEIQKQALYTFRELKQQMIFKDHTQKMFMVFLENLEFPVMPDIQNAMPVELTLTQSDVLNTLTNKDNNAKPPSVNSAAKSSLSSQTAQVGANKNIVITVTSATGVTTSTTVSYAASKTVFGVTATTSVASYVNQVMAANYKNKWTPPESKSA